MVTAAAEGKQAGKEARARAPRASHALWEPAADRRDTVDVLQEEAAARVPELVPIRHARMATSDFAFFRGAAGIMAADLAGTPTTGITAQLCGDAHISNFGGFASPERSLVFDLNDFDETLPGPWEWDVKRLATSVAIAARDRDFGDLDYELARRTATEYRLAMRRFARMPALEVWYARIDESELAAALRKHMGAREVRRFDRNIAKARAKDSTRAFAKLAYTTNGRVRIAADPPLITPVEDLAPEAEAERINEAMAAVVARYAETLPRERRRLLERYTYVHSARKVVGVGSVGTRAWVLLFVGRDHGDPLFLQAKEAERSVLEPHTAACEFDNQGQRVVEGQRLVQAASDIFLGWVRAEGVDGNERDFYVRQLWDWKTSAQVERMSARALLLYAELCAWTLARAHARTSDARAIAGYLGSTEKFDGAIGSFAHAYADQNERDYSAFVEAISDGRVEAAPSPLQ